MVLSGTEFKSFLIKARFESLLYSQNNCKTIWYFGKGNLSEQIKFWREKINIAKTFLIHISDF
jgi:hypothetical protein